ASQSRPSSAFIKAALPMFGSGDGALLPPFLSISNSCQGLRSGAACSCSTSFADANCSACGSSSRRRADSINAMEGSCMAILRGNPGAMLAQHAEHDDVIIRQRMPADAFKHEAKPAIEGERRRVLGGHQSSHPAKLQLDEWVIERRSQKLPIQPPLGAVAGDMHIAISLRKIVVHHNSDKLTILHPANGLGVRAKAQPKAGLRPSNQLLLALSDQRHSPFNPGSKHEPL